MWGGIKMAHFANISPTLFKWGKKGLIWRLASLFTYRVFEKHPISYSFFCKMVQKSKSLMGKLFQFLMESFVKNLNFWLVCTICTSNESWKHSNFIFGIKKRIVHEIFFKNWYFKIFHLTSDEKKNFEHKFFQTNIIQPS